MNRHKTQQKSMPTITVLPSILLSSSLFMQDRWLSVKRTPYVDCAWYAAWKMAITQCVALVCPLIQHALCAPMPGNKLIVPLHYVTKWPRVLVSNCVIWGRLVCAVEWEMSLVLHCMNAAQPSVMLVLLLAFNHCPTAPIINMLWLQPTCIVSQSNPWISDTQ